MKTTRAANNVKVTANGKGVVGHAVWVGETHLPTSASIASTKEVLAMAAVSIRNLDDQVRERLRIRAAANRRSMEAEIRAILAEAVSEPGDSKGLLASLVERFSEVGGVTLDLPERSATVRSPDLSE